MENQQTDKTEVKLTYEDQTVIPTEINMLESVVGRFKTVDSIPTTDITPSAGEYYTRPTKVSEQIVIYKNGTTQRLYWYDTKNDSWQYTAQPVASSVIAVRVTKSDGQSFYDSIDTIITWDGETFDTDTMHDNSTNNDRLTAKTAGYYQVTLNIGTNNTDGYFVKIFKGASSVIAMNTNSSSHSSLLSFCNLTTLIYLDVNDYVTSTIQKVISGASNLIATQCHFEMHKI